MRNFFIKKSLAMPINSYSQVVDSVQLWEVRWTSRKGRFSMETQPEIEAFTSESLANAFARDLRNAFMLVRQTGPETTVTVTKAPSYEP